MKKPRTVNNPGASRRPKTAIVPATTTQPTLQQSLRASDHVDKPQVSESFQRQMDTLVNFVDRGRAAQSAVDQVLGDTGQRLMAAQKATPGFDGVTIQILPNEKGLPAGQIATVVLHFSRGLLAGLRLEGFAVWERRASPQRNVTFPARTYSVNGERRSFALLRPDDDGAHNRLRDAILAAYAEYEKAQQAGL